MILVDASLLIYAVNRDAPHHRNARRWWEKALSGTLGNLTSDAHLAAMALENGADIYSADYDFQRFQGVRHCNPLD
jgi:predicted nucleic acid-binding protein